MAAFNVLKKIPANTPTKVFATGAAETATVNIGLFGQSSKATLDMKVLADSYTIPYYIPATGATRELVLANSTLNGVITAGGTNYAFLSTGNFDYATVDTSTLAISQKTPIVNSYRESDFAAGVALSNYGGLNTAIKKFSTAANLFSGTATSTGGTVPSYSSNGIFLSTSSTDSSWRGFAISANGYMSYTNSASPSLTWTNNTSSGSPYYYIANNFTPAAYQFVLFGRGTYGYCVSFNGNTLYTQRISNSGVSFDPALVTDVSPSISVDPSGDAINVHNTQQAGTPKYLWEIGGNVFYMVKVYSQTYYPVTGNHRRIFLFNGAMTSGTLGVGGFLGGQLGTNTAADWVFDGSFLPMPVQGGMVVKTSSGVFKLINSSGGATNYTGIPTSTFPVAGSNWATWNASKPARAFTPPSTVSYPTSASLTASGDKFLGLDGYVYTLTDNPYLTTLNQVGTDDDWLEKSLSLSAGIRADYSSVTMAGSQAVWITATADTYINVFGFKE